MDAFIRVKDGDEVTEVPLECFMQAILSILPEASLSQVMQMAVATAKKMKKPVIQLELSRIVPGQSTPFNFNGS